MSTASAELHKLSDDDKRFHDAMLGACVYRLQQALEAVEADAGLQGEVEEARANLADAERIRAEFELANEVVLVTNDVEVQG